MVRGGVEEEEVNVSETELTVTRASLFPMHRPPPHPVSLPPTRPISEFNKTELHHSPGAEASLPQRQKNPFYH
jgi:hypothetical protein